MQSASEQLRGWMERARVNGRAASRILDIHFTFLSQILNNKRIPSLTTAVRFERITGIPAEAWVPTRVDGQRVTAADKSRKVRLGKG